MAEAKVTIHDSTTFRNVLRWSFRSNVALNEVETKEALSRAVLALKLLNSTYAKQISEMEKKRKEHSDLTGIQFSIGQVVRHKRDGYRGVIHGWDRVCRYPQYVVDTDVNFVQPFYSIVPDENDAIRSFGGPRMLQYVAQEDLENLKEPFKVSNRAVLFHFESYSPTIGRYIPKAHLRYEYPGEYLQEDVQPCEGAELIVTDGEQKAKSRPCRRKRPLKRSELQSIRQRMNRPTRTPTCEKSQLTKVKGSDKVTRSGRVK